MADHMASMKRCAEAHELGMRVADKELDRIAAARVEAALGMEKASAAAADLARDLRCALRGLLIPRWRMWRFWMRVPVSSTVRARRNVVRVSVGNDGVVEAGFHADGRGGVTVDYHDMQRADRVLAYLVREVIRRTA